MNATVHAQFSVKRLGGNESEYYGIHDLMDHSKEVEATNRHRILSHHLLFVKQVVIPIFGSSFTNSVGKIVNIKDLCEFDHLLPDFSRKFIPTLSDYVDCIEDDKTDEDFIKTFQRENMPFLDENTQIKELLMAPLWNTGKIKSLLITHNSWFIGHILPKVFKNIKVEIKDFNISPQKLFARMSFEPWMDNGRGIPPSFHKIYESKKPKIKPSEATFDGKGSIAPYVSIMDGSPRIPLTEEMRDLSQFDGAVKEIIKDWEKPYFKDWEKPYLTPGFVPVSD